MNIEKRDEAEYHARMEFGRQVVAARTKRGWKQNDLADRIGYTHAQLSRIERGHSGPGFGMDLALLFHLPELSEAKQAAAQTYIRHLNA